MDDTLKGVFGIASALIGVAVLTLLLNPKANTVPVINAATSGFNGLLQTVSLQNGMGFSTNFMN